MHIFGISLEILSIDVQDSVSFYCTECVIVAIFRKFCLIWDIKRLLLH